jgi:hypothetical protein
VRTFFQTAGGVTRAADAILSFTSSPAHLRFALMTAHSERGLYLSARLLTRLNAALGIDVRELRERLQRQPNSQNAQEPYGEPTVLLHAVQQLR